MAKAAGGKGRDGMVVRFRGVRGSFPVSGEGFLRYGGNTSCVEVEAGSHRIVCDMGTGIIRLGNDLLRDHLRSSTQPAQRQPIQVVILVSHAHHDHTQGFPFFKPAYLESSLLYIFGPRMLNADFSEIMAKAMSAPLFPVDLADMHSNRVIRNVEESQIVILRKGKAPELANSRGNQKAIEPDAVVIRALRNLAHPKGGVINYRITFKGKSVVYATDVEGYVGGDARLVNFARGADLLIHDAQYLPEEYSGLPVPTQGFGHSTYEMAAAVASAAKVGKLALFHHDPSHSDAEMREIEKRTVKQFKSSFAAYEGQELTL